MREERCMGQRMQWPLNKGSHHRLSQPAERQAGHCHPELHRGEGVIERSAQLGHGAGTGPGLHQQLFDPGGPQTHQGELSRHEEAIRQNEADNGDAVEECPVDHVDRVKQRLGGVRNFLSSHRL